MTGHHIPTTWTAGPQDKAHRFNVSADGPRIFADEAADLYVRGAAQTPAPPTSLEYLQRQVDPSADRLAVFAGLGLAAGATLQQE